MSEQLRALLVHHHPALFEPLKQTLSDLSIVTHSAGTYQEGVELFRRYKHQIIFTERMLADGPWMRFLSPGGTSDDARCIIVVAEHPDTRLYTSIMERGAFDFVVPPFERDALRFVTRSAALACSRRRLLFAPAAVA